MAQVLRPESIGAVTRGSNTTLSIGASLAIIGGQQRQTSTVNITTSTSGINGIDTGVIAINQFYYVYLVINNGVIGGVISLSASAPTGFPAYKLVGQCTTDGSANLVAANKADTDNAPIGQVMSAMLSESQFRAIHGSGWILADGRSVSGSKYNTISGNTTAPDLRGQVLRGKNNGRADGNQNPDGDVALGAFQAHAVQTHYHDYYASAGPGGAQVPTGSFVPANWAANRTNNFYSSNQNTPGASENRMNNVTVNHFIKIN